MSGLRIVQLRRLRARADEVDRPFWDGALDAAKRKPPASGNGRYAEGYRIERGWTPTEFTRRTAAK